MLAFFKILVSISIATVSFCISPLYAAQPLPFPKDFLFQGKPIDALCIAKMAMGDSSRFDPVTLAQCTKHPEYKVESVNDSLIQNGYVGYSYAYQMSADFTERGHVYYKILGKFKDKHILYVTQNNGGSGFFTSIILVKRNKDALQLVKELAGGDRCNGGILDDVEIKNNKLVYNANITPYDMLALSNNKPETIKAYDDLAACAACCVGTALFEHDFSKPKLISVTISDNDGKNNTFSQGKYQRCFDKILKEYRRQGNLTFMPEDLTDFATKFTTKCVPVKKENKTPKPAYSY